MTRSQDIAWGICQSRLFIGVQSTLRVALQVHVLIKGDSGTFLSSGEPVAVHCTANKMAPALRR